MIMPIPLRPGAIRMSALHEQYALGRSPQEYARLARQAEILKPMTQSHRAGGLDLVVAAITTLEQRVLGMSRRATGQIASL
jgi:hypothetical protein